MLTSLASLATMLVVLLLAGGSLEQILYLIAITLRVRSLGQMVLLLVFATLFMVLTSAIVMMVFVIVLLVGVVTVVLGAVLSAIVVLLFRG